MCGLFGWALSAPLERKAAHRLAGALGAANDHRGGHSWGWADVEGGTVVRGLGRIGLRARAVAQALRVIGHTRWATTGARNLANAHPFRVGPIVGAHNGMVYNHAVLDILHDRAYAVDSQHLIAHLAERRTFADVRGYGSLAWHDERDDGLRLCRMMRGELAIAGLGTPKRIQGVVWSSTMRDLVDALDYARLAWFPYQTPAVGAVYLARPDGLQATHERVDLATEAPLRALRDQDWWDW